MFHIAKKKTNMIVLFLRLTIFSLIHVKGFIITQSVQCLAFNAIYQTYSV